MDRILQYLIVLGISLAPVSEQRGGIIYGLGMGLNPWAVLVIAIGSNILTLIPVFWILRKTKFRAWLLKVFGKNAQKHIHENKKFQIYEELALMAFVAVPVPFTGCYMGALISEILGWNWKKSFIAISAGVAISGIIVFLAAEGIISLIGLI
ncbi:MAG: small multi-drug export protein [archaeon]